MKKEFKAPIVETKNLSIENGIMDDGILLSATASNSNFTLWSDEDTQEKYKQWKKLQ